VKNNVYVFYFYLSFRVAIASRLDASGEEPNGNFGRKLYDEIVSKLETLSAPPPLKTVKALPIPDSERKKRRGGKRARKLKELYAQTEMQKQKNRLAFGETAEQEVFVGDRMEGMGMLGKGNLRAFSGATSETDSKLREHLKKHANHKLSTTGSSGTKSANLQTNTTITLPSTTLQASSASPEPLSKYFNTSSGFKRNKD
jgi:U4/U6 small nuclear ribonucleoprotein PRP31